MNKDIENKILEIVNYIKETESYKNYLKAKELLSLEENLVNIIEDIKIYQKEIIKNPNKKEELEEKIKNNLNILSTEPLYIEYINNQEEVNNMLTILENKLNKYFFDIFN